MLFNALLNRCRTAPLILVVLGLCSCGSGLGSLALGNAGTSVGVLYSIDSFNHRILRYTPNQFGSVTLDSSIDLPAGLTATLVTTDAAGDLYIGGYTASLNRSEVLVYDAAAADDDAPQRTVKLEPGKLIALAVDQQRTIYAAQQNGLTSIKVYPSNSGPGNSGADTHTRSIAGATFVDVSDLAVDSAGHLYVSGWNGTSSFIREYATAATGSAATLRTIWAPHGTTFGGLAVDDDGSIFVMENMTICELAAGATGTPIPIQTINLPAKFMAYSKEAYSNLLRRDGIGDFFVPVTMSGDSGALTMVYGFAYNDTGDATPILQFTAPDSTATGPHNRDIPLAVF